MGQKFRVIVTVEKEDGSRAEMVEDVFCFVGAHMAGQKEGRVLRTETPDCPLFGLEPSPHHDPALCLHCQKAAADPAAFGRQLGQIDAQIGNRRGRAQDRGAAR